MTLDRLATMVAGRFDEMSEQMKGLATKDETNARLDAVDQRLGRVEFNVDEIREGMQRLEEGDILNLQKRMKLVERTVKTLAKPAR